MEGGGRRGMFGSGGGSRGASKVYCDRCDAVFGSRPEYERHLERHSGGGSCEACPLDTAVSKIAGLFKRGQRR